VVGVWRPMTFIMTIIKTKVSICLHSHMIWSLPFSIGCSWPNSMIWLMIWMIIDNKVSIWLHFCPEVFTTRNQTFLLVKSLFIVERITFLFSFLLMLSLMAFPIGLISVGWPCSLIVFIINAKIAIFLHFKMMWSLSFMVSVWSPYWLAIALVDNKITILLHS